MANIRGGDCRALRILPSQQTGIGRHRGDTIIGHRASDSLRVRLYSGIRANLDAEPSEKRPWGGQWSCNSGVATVECDSHTNGGSSGSSFRMLSNAGSSFRVSLQVEWGGKSFQGSSSIFSLTSLSFGFLRRTLISGSPLG